jgi:hypothetical protein
MYLTKSNFTFSCSAPMKRYGRTMKKLMLRYLCTIDKNKQMVQEFGKAKAEELLKEFQVKPG